MIRSAHLPQSKGLGLTSAIVFGFILAAFVAICFSCDILPVQGSAAQLGGEGFPWSSIR